MPAKTKAPAPPQTGWWSTPPAAWADLAEEAGARWQKSHRGKNHLEPEVMQRAMAFGYGAREEYGQHKPWKDLGELLPADWKAAGHETDAPWEQVHLAVKAGWTAAGAPEEEAITMPVSVQQPHPSADPAEPGHLVPGGRPDHPPPPPPAPRSEVPGPLVPGGRPDHPVIPPAPASEVPQPQLPGGRPDRPNNG